MSDETKPAFLTAEWRSLAMINYEIDPAALRPLVPSGTELDDLDGRHFVSMVGFLFLDTEVLGIPIPFHRDFEEVNLRFYVRRRVGSEWHRGVVFVKEVVPRLAVAKVARWIYNENYVTCPTRSNIDIREEGGLGLVEYGWTCDDVDNMLSVEFSGYPAPPVPGSEEEFLSVRLWGFSAQRDGSTIEYQVEHPAWHLWAASRSKLVCDVESFYGPEFVDALSGNPSSSFVADGSPVVVRQGELLGR